MERSPLGMDTNEPPECVREPLYLSAIASESSNTIRARSDKEALRPIYLNGVEVGFAYAQNDVDKRLSVRGVTIALFHFLAAGHQVLALLPHCFKLYREKSTDHEELLALHRMNLVEFTPGYGSDKYVEVNRLAAGAAFESGGCIVARSQMQTVVSERPCLEEIVEKRLLMPSFMGEDIIFPIDGPLGRIGASLAETLICRPTDADYAACARSQLLFADQRAWLQRLSNLLPEKLAWSSLASHFATWQPTRRAVAPEPEDTGLCITLAGPIRPPESNPAHGRGFSAMRRRTNNFARDHYNCPERLRDTRDPAAEENDDEDFLPSYAVGDRYLPPESSSTPRDPLDDGQELHIGRPGSLYRIVSADEMASREREHSTAVAAAAKPAETRESAFRRGAGDFAERQLPGPRRFGFGSSPPRRHTTSRESSMIYSPPRASHHDTQPQQPQHPAFSQLALVLGFELAKKVTQKHPRETDMNRLANLALDITASSPSTPVVDAVTTPPSRSASTTSSNPSESRHRRPITAFSTPSASRNSSGGARTPSIRYGGSSSRNGGAPLARSRTNSTPSSTGAPAATDAFVTAVSAAIPHSSAASSAVSPRSSSFASVAPAPPVFHDDEEVNVGHDASDLRTDATAPDDTAAADDEDDLIDWEGEAAEQTVHSIAPLTVESAHLLD
ncbi:hypothetical protein PRIPAC_91105 [Pristionchus pacificus]|uniref:RNase NYN domain-containing protein n=1 Tax=Pristionchus pacificus TaxID=54126 RepID=A0A2A6B3I1_PRIPA|nr:hypothetical protein PRIPAC_91105 [Pristionchus pacificus]|eukprot:PDM60445.1 hypothetical protein PRIPAC_53423 [Pristionchus pacificus]